MRTFDVSVCLTFECRRLIFGEGQWDRMNDQHTQLAEEENKGCDD